MILKPKERFEVQLMLSIPVLMGTCYLVWPPKRKSFHTGSSLNQTVCSGCNSTTLRTRQKSQRKPRLFAFQFARCTSHKAHFHRLGVMTPHVRTPAR